MIGHNNLGIEGVPIACFKGRCAVYSDLYDVVLSVIFAKNEILLWLIDDIDETGITQLFHDIAGIFAHGNVWHADFAHSKVRCGYLFILQAGKLGLMCGEFLFPLLIDGIVNTAAGEKSNNENDADEDFPFVGTIVIDCLGNCAPSLAGMFFVLSGGPFFVSTLFFSVFCLLLFADTLGLVCFALDTLFFRLLFGASLLDGRGKKVDDAIDILGLLDLCIIDDMLGVL
nr:MAG TPA: hypothetical protein [Caudoviricetes sp.]